MASMWKVLAPVDLRFDTEAQVEYAAGVAGVLGAELSLLHVSTGKWYQHPHRLGWPPSAFGAQTADLDIHRLVLTGPIAETIVRYADRMDADLILMATRAYGSRRPWRKSITKEVLKATRRRPVFIRKQIDLDLGGCFRCRRVLCVVGLDGQDEAVFQQAQNIASRTNAELVILHAVPPVNEGLLAYGLENQGARPLSVNFAREKLAELTKGLCVPFRTSVMVGSAAACIASAAREHTVDLIITARATSGAYIERSGAYTAELKPALARLNCPVLTVALEQQPRDRNPVEVREIAVSSRSHSR